MATATKRNRNAGRTAHPDKREQDVADRYGITKRRHLGTDYDPEKIDAVSFSGVLYKPRGYYDEWRQPDGQSEAKQGGPEGPPERHVESTPHGRSIIQRRKILKPVEAIEGDGRLILIDGLDRWFLAQQYGIPCPVEVLEGLRMERVRDYIIEINSARGSPSLEDRKEQARLYMEAEESRLKTGEVTLRSAYNKVAVICNLAHSTAKKIEREHFRETRWAAACAGETHEAVNGNKCETKECDPESKIDGLMSKLDPSANCTRSERETAIKLIRGILKKYKDVLPQHYIKKVEAAAEEAESLLKKEQVEEERLQREAEAAVSPPPGNRQPEQKNAEDEEKSETTPTGVQNGQPDPNDQRIKGERLDKQAVNSADAVGDKEQGDSGSNQRPEPDWEIEDGDLSEDPEEQFFRDWSQPAEDFDPSSVVDFHAGGAGDHIVNWLLQAARFARWLVWELGVEVPESLTDDYNTFVGVIDSWKDWSPLALTERERVHRQQV